MSAIFTSFCPPPPPPIISFMEMATSISELHQAHAYMLKTGLFQQPFAASRLMTAAASSSIDSLSYAHTIFTQTPQPNTYMYNTLIRGYATSPTPNVALFLFLKLLCDDQDLLPDKYTYTFVLKACASLCRVKHGKQIHGCVIKNGLSWDVYICNTLLHMYAKCGCFEAARHMLDRMPNRDVVSWNAVLSVYVEMGLVDLAFDFFSEMPVKNLESWNFMLSGYANSGLLDEAWRVFDEMSVKDVVSWNALITGYANSGRYNEVLELFDDMQRARVKPDNHTLVTLLSACAGIGALEQGKWVRAYMDRNGIEANGFLATALVDMYSKCGCIEKAVEVFDSASRKDVSTWNAMITGFSVHGFGEQALKVFSEMVENGFKPNDVTFVSLLSACSRAGLLFESHEIFDNMFSIYGIKPKIEHYGCLVDLLGRFGLLKEAEELVEKMPQKDVLIIWESLLSACRNHGNVELAEHIAGKLLELNPQDNAGYVQLSNIHASKGRWSDVVDIRRKMREKLVSKKPGGSVIEVNGVVHEFLAGEGMI
ncbi:pentatricopeptide repeat-containing protein At4g18840-like [Coffea arabica]|uniref:Pentatricopeptide repeat-containing protein At4g18840-like n=1 Tax=Coffea arabica TaxID=13443 RepID=A0ABM4WFM9_COFAR|nr:pentatricopeptide repeat-containing protein At4g18840 [Coffea arabica]XP_027105609.1 pentatricopeptide repeat-containing protein At4g18840 [Coffea arabica]XP_027105610.1 pentatricopeptide repeat-containing protein At4g18840 [Coffea arabica]XP_027105611.1 pentatricopeptide repeat-containing protein At4g18840 [Coffea arabica]